MVGDNIKRIRIEKGITQEDLGSHLGVSDKTISSWEINRTIPNIGTIEKIAEYLGCRKTELV